MFDVLTVLAIATPTLQGDKEVNAAGVVYTSRSSNKTMFRCGYADIELIAFTRNALAAFPQETSCTITFRFFGNGISEEEVIGVLRQEGKERGVFTVVMSADAATTLINVGRGGSRVVRVVSVVE